MSDVNWIEALQEKGPWTIVLMENLSRSRLPKEQGRFDE